MNPIALPLSPNQQAIWLDEQIHGSGSLYLIGGFYKIEGDLDEALMVQAINSAMESIDIFSSTLQTKDEGIPQMVFGLNEIKPTEILDFSEKSNPEKYCEEWMQDDFEKPFDPNCQFFYSIKLLKGSDRLFFWYFKIHHLLIDSWSYALFFQQVEWCYNKLTGQTDLKAAKPASFPYATALQKESDYLKSSNYWADHAYWKEKLMSFPDPLFQRTPQTAKKRLFKNQNRTLTIPRALVRSLENNVKTHQATSFQLWLGLLALALYRTTGKDHFCIGIPILNRGNFVAKNTIGLFSGESPLLIKIPKNGNFIDLVNTLKDTIRSDFRHQKFPISEISSLYPLSRDYSGNLYDVTFSYEKQRYTLTFGAVRTTVQSLNGNQSNVPLAITIRDYHEDNPLLIDLESIPLIFPEWKKNELEKVLMAFLHRLSAGFSIPIRQLIEPTTQEFDAITARGRGPVGKKLTVQNVAEAFERQVRLVPDRAALVTPGKTFTYSLLNTKANQLAHSLITDWSIKKGDLVALHLDRSTEMAIAILATLKAGAGWVPIDPGLPVHRKEFMLQDCSASLLVILEKDVRKFPDLRPPSGAVLVFERQKSMRTENPTGTARPTDPAYVIYTSGTTGKPKGVLIEQQALLQLRDGVESTLFGNYSAPLHFAFTDSCSFDASIQSLPGNLLHGHTLHIIPDHLKNDPVAFLKYLADQAIDIIDCTPSYLKMLALADSTNWKNPQLLAVLVGGETLETREAGFALEQLLRPDGVLYNLYGPTECTINATWHQVSPASLKDCNDIPIGKPLPETEIYILNDEMLPVPIGVPGQIFLGGSRLAKGYLNRPDLTAGTFRPHPFDPGKKIYATGDLGILRPDGFFVFIGRNDQQVKIRGYRIEIGEIETILNKKFPTSQTIVAPKLIDGNHELVAYCINNGKSQQDQWFPLKAYLQQEVPAYMVPRFWITLETWPLNTSGKLDRASLPSPLDQDVIADPDLESDNHVQKQTVRLWRKTLRQPVRNHQDNFFEKGGNSLLAVKLAQQIEKEFNIQYPVNLIFNFPNLDQTIENVHQRIGVPNDLYKPIPKTPAQKHYPTSNGQLRLYLIQQSDPASFAYHVPSLLTLKHPLKETAVKEALQLLWNRHPSLRAGFFEYKGALRQFFRSEQDWMPEVEAIDDLPTTVISKRVANYYKKPFNLHHDPLFRVLLLTRNGNVEKMVLNLHHCITDGWSMEILIKELNLLLNDFFSNSTNRKEDKPKTSLTLPKVPVTYPDYSRWLEQMLADPEENKRLHTFWKTQLTNIPALKMPGELSTSARIDLKGREATHSIRSELFLNWVRMVEKNGNTLYHSFSALIKTLIYRYTGEKDLTVGTVVSGRVHPDLDQVVGFFVNFLPLRSVLIPESPFLQNIQLEKKALIQVLDHQLMPFDTLVEHYHHKPENPYPFFEYVVTVEENAPVEDAPKGFLNEWLAVEPEVAKTPLRFHLETSQGHAELKIEYQTCRFTASFIQKMSGHLENLMTAILKNPQTPLYALDYLDGQDNQIIKQAFQHTTQEFNLPDNIAVAFEKQVLETPHRAAIVFENEVFTYDQLNKKANQLANALQKEGIGGPEQVIAIQTERTPWMVIAILGVTKTGSAWLPLDSKAPAARRKFMLEDSGAVLLLVDQTNYQSIQKERLQAIPARLLETYLDADIQSPFCPAQQTQLAYILYTSGTTGQPKGVMIEQRSLLNEAHAIHEGLFRHLAPQLNIALLSSFFFDASVLFVPGALIKGHTVHFYGRFEKAGVQGLFDLFNDHPIHLVEATPTFYKLFLASASPKFTFPPSLKGLIAGGEKVERSLFLELKKCVSGEPVQFINIYGPTETTISASCYRVLDVAAQPSVIPIGYPFPNFHLYILDQYFRPLPAGIPGQLFIGGAGVGRGYLNQPELTSRKFLPNPYDPGKKMFATGDKVRFLENGAIQFMGRIDQQVKIRGYRIELGEIEQVLHTFSPVRQAVVIPRTLNDQTVLIAYLTLKQGANQSIVDEIEKMTETYLPDYMIPRHWVVLETIPQNSSGKPSINALPMPENQHVSNPKSLNPVSETQQTLLEIWGDLLPKAPASLADSFFSLGGQSIYSIALSARIEQAFSLAFPVRFIYENPTFGEMARAIDQLRKNRTDQPLPRQKRFQKIWKKHFSPRPKGEMDSYPNPILHPEITRKFIEEINTVFGKNLTPDQIQAGTLPEVVYDVLFKVEETALQGYLTVNKGNTGTLFAFPPAIASGLFFMGWKEVFKDYSLIAFDFLQRANLLDEYILRIKQEQPVGPYYLLGYSAGGNMAFEIAKKLEESGESVEQLLLIDAATNPQNPDFTLADAAAEAEKIINLFSIDSDKNPIAPNLQMQIDVPRLTERITQYIFHTTRTATSGKIRAAISVFLSQDPQEVGDRRVEWKNHTTGKFQLINAYGSHHFMFSEQYGKMNQEIIRAEIPSHLDKKV